jgi:hypothetical protein
MARSLDVAPAEMARIALRVANLAPDIEGELTESFELYTLGAEDIASASLTAAESAGQAHHQIKHAGAAIGYARSATTTSGVDVVAVRITELPSVPPGLAAGIDAAVRLIDAADLASEPLVRLLVVPAHAVHALWIASDQTDRLVVVDCPGSSALTVNTIYEAADFLAALAAEPVSAEGAATWPAPP